MSLVASESPSLGPRKHRFPRHRMSYAAYERRKARQILSVVLAGALLTAAAVGVILWLAS